MVDFIFGSRAKSPLEVRDAATARKRALASNFNRAKNEYAKVGNVAIADRDAATLKLRQLLNPPRLQAGAMQAREPNRHELRMLLEQIGRFEKQRIQCTDMAMRMENARAELKKHSSSLDLEKTLLLLDTATRELARGVSSPATISRISMQAARRRYVLHERKGALEQAVDGALESLSDDEDEDADEDIEENDNVRIALDLAGVSVDGGGVNQLLDGMRVAANKPARALQRTSDPEYDDLAARLVALQSGPPVPSWDTQKTRAPSTVPSEKHRRPPPQGGAAGL